MVWRGFWYGVPCAGVTGTRRGPHGTFGTDLSSATLTGTRCGRALIGVGNATLAELLGAALTRTRCGCALIGVGMALGTALEALT